MSELTAAVAIVCGPPMREHSRRSIGVKWCFKCRGRHPFSWVVLAADIDLDDPRMYMADPIAHSECGNCKQRGGELFPGWSYADE